MPKISESKNKLSPSHGSETYISDAIDLIKDENTLSAITEYKSPPSSTRNKHSILHNNLPY